MGSKDKLHRAYYKNKAHSILVVKVTIKTKAKLLDFKATAMTVNWE